MAFFDISVCIVLVAIALRPTIPRGQIFLYLYLNLKKFFNVASSPTQAGPDLTNIKTSEELTGPNRF